MLLTSIVIIMMTDLCHVVSFESTSCTSATLTLGERMNECNKSHHVYTCNFASLMIFSGKIIKSFLSDLRNSCEIVR